MKLEILLIGGGGHCKSVIDVIEQEDKYTIAGIIDKKELVGTKVLDYKVIGCDDDIINLIEKSPPRAWRNLEGIFPENFVNLEAIKIGNPTKPPLKNNTSKLCFFRKFFAKKIAFII